MTRMEKQGLGLMIISTPGVANYGGLHWEIFLTINCIGLAVFWYGDDIGNLLKRALIRHLTKRCA